MIHEIYKNEGRLKGGSKKALFDLRRKQFVSKSKNYFSKNLFFSILTTLIIGVVLIAASAYFQQSILLDTLKVQTHSMTSVWANKLSVKDVESALENKDWESPGQKRLTTIFDSFSENNLNVAQAYIFGAELQDGNKTSLIAFPTHLVTAFKEANLNIGDMYEQPSEVAVAIESMLKSKKETFTKVYNDDFGTWMSVLYPILNSNGEVVAYFAVDVNAEVIPNGLSSFLKASISLLLISLLVSVGMQYFVARKTLLPLNELIWGIEQVAHGKFNFSLSEKGSFGELNKQFNAMISNMRTVLSSIKQTATNVLDASNELYQITEDNSQSIASINFEVKDMSNHVDVQKSSTEECNRSIEDISRSLQEIAENASEVAATSQDMKHKSEDGNIAVQTISNQMLRINETSLFTSETMKLLEFKAKEIGDILNIVKGITEQTNLLALNASIEAARAGEHGKGFSVVAEEVRKLADQSGNSTDKISNLIADIQSETNKAVEYANKGTEEAKKGLNIANQTGEVFIEILNSINMVVDQVEGISSSTQQMSAGTEEVSSMMDDLTDIAKKTAGSTTNIKNTAVTQESSLQEISTFASNLSNVADELNSMVSKFET